MERLETIYKRTIQPELAKELSLKNKLAVPKVTKVVVNMGLSDKRFDDKKVQALSRVLATIVGQKPTLRRARKAISSFKIREGDAVALALTIRGKRMYDFLERVIRIALPRIRDFRGISKKQLDGHGNLTIGIRELSVFPEVVYQDIELGHSLEITMVTSAKTNAQAEKLLAACGIPFVE